MPNIEFDSITALDLSLKASLQHKIDQKTKPIGALGQLESIALQIGLIQKTLNPSLSTPHLLIFAGDHGVAANKEVSLYPQEVTYQMVLNFLNGGAAINVFCRQHDIALVVIDAGINGVFDKDISGLIHQKVRAATRDYTLEKAINSDELQSCMDYGKQIVEKTFNNGCNIIGFGEMGIGNTSSAALIMHAITGEALEDCVGRGTGLDAEGVRKKSEILKKVVDLHQGPKDPMDVLMCYGGLEIAQQCGAMIAAAALGMTIIIDGFITTSALLVASKLNPAVLSYCLASHQSDESGHAKMLSFLNLKPILNLDLRLGEGSGCALAYPIIQSATLFMNEMASFEDASVTNKL